MDFYIFWKFGFCRTPPSLRQLFYPLVNLPSPHPTLSISPSILLIPHLSPYFYSNILPHSTHAPHPILSTPSPYSHPSLINKLSTTYPQLFHKLSTTPYSIHRHLTHPTIPTYIAISPIIPIIISTQIPSKVIHRYIKLSTSYPQSNILIHRLSTDISILSYV